MNREQIFRRENLELKIVEEDAAVRLYWQGVSAEKDPTEFLDPIIADFFERARDGSRELQMDFTRLEFMNSLTLKPIIQLLYSIKKDRDNLGLRIKIRYAKSVLWQTVNFRSLKALRTSDNRIEFEAV